MRCLEELEAMCFWHSCHSPFEKCIKAIAKLVGLGMGTQSRDHHPNLSGEDGRELLLIVEGLKCATVPLNNKNKHPGQTMVTESCNFCVCRATVCRNNLSVVGFFSCRLKISETDCVVIHACIHTWLLAEMPSALRTTLLSTFCSEKLRISMPTD